MSYRVIAPLVIAKDQDGRPHHVYEGGVIQWLSDEQAEHFLGTGLVEEIDGDEGGEEWPDESWKRDEIDAFSADRGIDTTGAANKAEALELLNAG